MVWSLGRRSAPPDFLVSPCCQFYGSALAERVVAWRDENGPFTSVDELEEVSGIGPSVLEQVRDLVRV
ncbi:helix-hairpin-helix domain-containing protein [Isoptericola cucumis]|uniref:ComEA family DNA-binding protein n=1 Tax=Isoptericola cucumis TaxID=1776856 RepID=UPI00320A0C36